MALITIKDLLQSDDLDREAMRSIVGGGLTGVRPVQSDQAKAGSGRIVDYPPGFGRQGPIPGRSRRSAG
jgi:hypothetical protein